jgi:hypothetical protein
MCLPQPGAQDLDVILSFQNALLGVVNVAVGMGVGSGQGKAQLRLVRADDRRQRYAEKTVEDVV